MGKQDNNPEERRFFVSESELQNLVNSILKSIGIETKIELALDFSNLVPPQEDDGNPSEEDEFGPYEDEQDEDEDVADEEVDESAELINNMTVGDLLDAITGAANGASSKDLSIVESSYDEETGLYCINGKYYQEGALLMGNISSGVEVMVNLFPEALATGGIGRPLDVTHFSGPSDEGVLSTELDYARAQKKALESGEVCWGAVCRFGYLNIFCNTFYNRITDEQEHLIKLFNCVPCQDNSIRSYCATSFEIDDFVDMVIVRKLKGFSVSWPKIIERQKFLASKGELEDPGSLDVEVDNAFYEVTPQVRLPDAAEKMHPEVYDAFKYNEEPCDDEVTPGAESSSGGCVDTEVGMGIGDSGQQDSSSKTKQRRSKAKVSKKTSTRKKSNVNQESESKNGNSNK